MAEAVDDKQSFMVFTQAELDTCISLLAGLVDVWNNPYGDNYTDLILSWSTPRIELTQSLSRNSEGLWTARIVGSPKTVTDGTIIEFSYCFNPIWSALAGVLFFSGSLLAGLNLARWLLLTDVSISLGLISLVLLTLGALARHMDANYKAELVLVLLGVQAMLWKAERQSLGQARREEFGGS